MVNPILRGTANSQKFRLNLQMDQSHMTLVYSTFLYLVCLGFWSHLYLMVMLELEQGQELTARYWQELGQEQILALATECCVNKEEIRIGNKLL